MRISTLVAAIAGAVAQMAWAPPPLLWEGPLAINDTSGTVKITGRAFLNTNAAIAAAAYVTASGAMVEFDSCYFDSVTGCFFSNYNIGAKFTNCKGICRNPNVAGVYNPGYITGTYNYLVVENNTMIGGGMRISGINPTTLRIRWNRAYNIEGRVSDGAGGYQGPVGVARQFFQINGNLTCGSAGNPALIEWNYIENDPDVCTMGGDVISLHGAVKGYSNSDRMKIRFNMLNGNLPLDYATRTGYGGRGIMMEAGAGQYIDVEYNRSVRLQSLVTINEDGHFSDVSITGNICIYSHKYKTIGLKFGPAFPYLANALSTGTNQVWSGNVWQYQSQSYDATGGDPFVKNAGNAGNGPGTGWVERSYDVAHIATEADEAAEVAAWWASIAVDGGGHAIGSSLS